MRDHHPNLDACKVLDRLADILYSRGSVYGPASEHFERTSRILSVVLPPGAAIGAREWAVVMICDKLARLGNPHCPPEDKWSRHLDTIEDVAGYAALLAGMIRREQQPDPFPASWTIQGA